MKLKSEHPEAFAIFERVWSVRNKHMVPNLPDTYVFFFKSVAVNLDVYILLSQKK